MSGEGKSISRYKTAVVVQCRLSSTRLPSKALLQLGGLPVLEYTLLSMHSVPADFYCVATDASSAASLSPIAEKCGFVVFVGSLDDVLNRYCSAIKKFNLDTVIRATADNPFLFHEAASALLARFTELSGGANPPDYMTFTGLPHGSGVEIFKASSLLKAVDTATAYDHEHVGPALYKHPDIFKSVFETAPTAFRYPFYRTTIDTPHDYRVACGVQYRLQKAGVCPPYSTKDILAALSGNSARTMIFIPRVAAGFGTGHLRRCIKWAKDTGQFLYFPLAPSDSAIDSMLTMDGNDDVVRQYPSTASMELVKNSALLDWQFVRDYPRPGEFDVIVTDLFEATPLEQKNILSSKENGVLLTVDEGTDFAERADYALSILDREHFANLSAPYFIDLPTKTRAFAIPQGNTADLSVLLTFGGEDASGLAEKCAARLASSFKKITIIKNGIGGLPSNVTVLPFLANLKDELSKYDIVITHYGLTAYESLCAGAYTILVAPTAKHARLSKIAGFVVWDMRKPIDTVLSKKAFDQHKRLYDAFVADKKEAGGGFLSFIKDVLLYASSCKCPVCGNSSGNKTILRDPKKTYRMCARCKTEYLAFFTGKGGSSSYTKEYFFSEYKAQYGKTYIEDFDKIKAMGVSRLLNIVPLCKAQGNKTVLDIGCAYGPFMVASQEAGFEPFGIDFCKDASIYVNENLGFKSTSGDFLQVDIESALGVAQFDVVTMWYVIEHFSDINTLLAKIASIVKIGGVFAFSTPSASGISSLVSKTGFLHNSPSDHFVILDPKKISKLLSKYGFRVQKIVSTGCHPQRIPPFKNIKQRGIFCKLITKLMAVFQLGDTFEVYATKVR